MANTEPTPFFSTSTRFMILFIAGMTISLAWAGISSALAAPDRSGSIKSGTPRPISQLDRAPGQLIVKFNSFTTPTGRSLIMGSAGVKKQIKHLSNRGGTTVLVKVDRGRSLNSVINKLKASPSVIYAEPNYITKLAFTPNDSHITKQYWLNNTGQSVNGSSGIADADIDGFEVFDVERGGSSPVNVAIIDSGLDTGHPDLAGKLWVNAGETPGNFIDDDGNGYVDDVNGYNFGGISQLSLNAGWEVGRYNTLTMAQSLKGTGQQLSSVGLLMAKTGAPTALNICVSTTLSRSNCLASGAFTGAEVDTAWDLLEKNLDSSPVLTNGQTYYILFWAAAADASNYFTVTDNCGALECPDGYTPDPYREGIEIWCNNADCSNFTNYPTDDWFFITNQQGNPRDDNGHGTHVGGIVAAATNNAAGIAGTAPEARLMAIKAGDSSGSLLNSDIVDALNYAADNDADIANMSFGGSGISTAIDDAVQYASGGGVLLFAAAGNDGSADISYPAGYDNVVGVGATNSSDNIASFSQHNAKVDISAPGVNIYSTMPTYPVGLNSFGIAQNYAFLNGTSMATPVAAGVGALILARDPSLTPAQVEALMMSTSDDKGAAGYDNYYGAGRINAAAAVSSVTQNETSAPVTKLLTVPAAANGENGWFTTAPTATLSRNESGTTHYRGFSAPLTDWNDSSDWDAAMGTLGAGTHNFQFYSEDSLGNIEATVDAAIKVDTANPSGTVTINGGAAATKPQSVTLATTKSDLTSGVDRMRFSNDGVFDSPAEAWKTWSASSSWALSAGDGTKTVRAQFKDEAGRVSTVALDTIIRDTTAPKVSLSVPGLSTSQSKSRTITVKWSGSDGGSGIQNYDLQYRVAGGSWINWKNATTAKQVNFTGWPGNTYYFRVRARDKVGNLTTYPATGSSVVFPIDNTAVSYQYGWWMANSLASPRYLGTSRYTTRYGNIAGYWFRGSAVWLIITKGKAYGSANVYIDGKWRKTVNSYAGSTYYRQAVWIGSVDPSKSHHIKVVNKATKGHARFEIDGIAFRK